VPVSYHVFLPAAPSPAAKIPVVIFGHGFSDSQFGGPTAIASTLAKAGFATLAMEFVGHGFGPASVAALLDSSGQHVVSTPGRGIPLSPDGSIGATDGCIVPGPLAVRDCFRQSAVDLMALVRNIGANGLGVNLDPSRIYYVGHSLGSFIGSVLHAVEPNVISAVFNSGGDSPVDTARLRLADQLTDFYLLTYNGILAATVGDAPTTDPTFDYFFPYRGQLTETVVAGHGDIQTVLEVADWMHVPGAPMAFAPHFEVQPLPGVPRKETLFQFSFGDLEVPNPVQSALVRAAVAIDQNPDALLPVEYLRFDLAVAADPHLADIFMPGLPFSILPHRLLANTTLLDPANADELVLTLEVQRQIANFFKFGSVGPTLPLFENLTLSTLPDSRNFTWPFQLAPGS
jgi:pimeloyl-ACP methyl ester carboxylesterase